MGKPALFFTPVNDTTYIDQYPAGYQGTHCYYVTSIFHTDSMGTLLCEGISDTICFEFPTGIINTSAGFVTIHPNPATDNLIIESEQSIENIVLSDCFGRTVIDKQGISEKTIVLSMAGFPSGIYLLKVCFSRGMVTKKVIKY